MRRHTHFRVIMHDLGANLNLDRSACRVAHNGVQGLVAVGLGSGYVVVKLLRQLCELAVHPTEGGVTIRNRTHHDAQRPDVVDLIKAQRLAAHLLHDAVDVFGPALHRRNNALRPEFGLQP